MDNWTEWCNHWDAQSTEIDCIGCFSAGSLINYVSECNNSSSCICIISRMLWCLRTTHTYTSLLTWWWALQCWCDRAETCRWAHEKVGIALPIKHAKNLIYFILEKEMLLLGSLYIWKTPKNSIVPKYRFVEPWKPNRSIDWSRLRTKREGSKGGNTREVMSSTVGDGPFFGHLTSHIFSNASMVK